MTTKTDDIKLLPCPFCGGDAEMDTLQGYLGLGTGRLGNRIAVYCQRCDADMGVCIEDVPNITPEQVADMWNRRAAASKLQPPAQRSYDPNGHLAEYGIIPECDAPKPEQTAATVPSDEDILALWKSTPETMWGSDVLGFARAVLERYGQPAASAEPVGPVRLRDEGSEIYLDGVRCQYSIEQGKSWPYSDTLAYVFDPDIAERIVAALNSAPVAQEPVAYLIRGEQQHDQFRMDLAQAKACKRLRDKDFDGEDKTAIIPLYAAPVASQAQHPDDAAVDAFAAAMKAKLAQKRAEGRGGWEDKTQCSQDRLSLMLRGHVAKGDPVDVANFAMMLHQRGERISGRDAASPSAQDREDAERWRWLRANAALQSYFTSQTQDIHAWVVMHRRDRRVVSYNGADLDAAIDAARAAKGE